MADIRIKDLPETLDVGAGDYVAVDNAGEGTRKFTLRQLVASVGEDISSLDMRVTAIESGGGGGGGLSQTEKNLILTLFSKAAYAESDAGTVYDELEELWTTTTRTVTYNLSHVSSSNTTASIEHGQSYTTTLTASTDYTLNIVAVTMGGVDITSTAYSSGTITIPSVTGNIVITATAVLAAESITATYTQSGTVYDTDSLDSLKADLVVTANYSGGTSETVPASNYTLSGTLAEGTSTITVNYAGLTDTFDVTVTHMRTSPFVPSAFVWRNGYYIPVSGANAGILKENTALSVTEMFDISGFTNIRVEDTAGTALRQYKVRFYQTTEYSTESFVSGQDGYIRKDNASYPSPVDISVPSGANYCVVECSTNVINLYADGILVLTAS